MNEIDGDVGNDDDAGDDAWFAGIYLTSVYDVCFGFMVQKILWMLGYVF